MPQISQLPMVFWSQLFWLLVIFAIVFFVIGRGMLPKIQSTVDARDRKVAEDLERAQAARVAADETEAQWRVRMDAAKQSSAKATEAKVKKAADKIGLKVDAASSKIREALEAARAEIEAVAAEASQEMVRRLTGITVDKKEAAAAVKAELHV
jgi:F-type H+-transporting ATPase subunit b